MNEHAERDMEQGVSELEAEPIDMISENVAAPHAPKGWDNSTLINRENLTDDLAVFRVRLSLVMPYS